MQSGRRKVCLFYWKEFLFKNCGFSIFRYASFGVIFPRNGIYVLKSEPVGSRNCSGLTLQYQVRRETQKERETVCEFLACLCIWN